MMPTPDNYIIWVKDEKYHSLGFILPAEQSRALKLLIHEATIICQEKYASMEDTLRPIPGNIEVEDGQPYLAAKTMMEVAGTPMAAVIEQFKVDRKAEMRKHILEAFPDAEQYFK